MCERFAANSARQEPASTGQLSGREASSCCGGRTFGRSRVHALMLHRQAGQVGEQGGRVGRDVAGRGGVGVYGMHLSGAGKLSERPAQPAMRSVCQASEIPTGKVNNPDWKPTSQPTCLAKPSGGWHSVG